MTVTEQCESVLLPHGSVLEIPWLGSRVEKNNYSIVGPVQFFSSVMTQRITNVGM